MTAFAFAAILSGMKRNPRPEGYDAGNGDFDALMMFEGHLAGNEGYPEDGGYAAKERNTHKPFQGVINKEAGK